LREPNLYVTFGHGYPRIRNLTPVFREAVNTELINHKSRQHTTDSLACLGKQVFQFSDFDNGIVQSRTKVVPPPKYNLKD